MSSMYTSLMFVDEPYPEEISEWLEAFDQLVRQYGTGAQGGRDEAKTMTAVLETESND